MDAIRHDIAVGVQAPVPGGLNSSSLAEPPAPEQLWKPSAHLIAGLDDAGLVGEWPPTESIDLAVWKKQPKRQSWFKISQAIH